MPLTLHLPVELERQLRARAAQCGKAVETLARELIEQGVSARSDLDTILAPLRQQVAASGIGADGRTSLLEEEEEEQRWGAIHSHTRHPFPPETKNG